jgi:hypothetical protein
VTEHGVVASSRRRPVDLGPAPLPCQGQLLPLPAGRYDWVYLSLEAAPGTETVVQLHYRDGAVDPEWLRADAPRVPVARDQQLAAVRLPDDEAIRIVAMALAPTPEVDP